MDTQGRTTVGSVLTALCALLSANDVATVSAQHATSQAAPATTSPSTAGTWLRVVADSTRVYSRPDVNSLAVAELARDDVLRSVALDGYGWYRVQPPPGVFSYVSAEFVQRDGPDRGVVRVRSSSLRVRVGSLLHDVDPLQTEVQARLERGDVVHIIGEQGAWLKILPPEGVVFYIRQRDVEPVSEEVARRLRPRAFQSRIPPPTTAPVARATPPKPATVPGTATPAARTPPSAGSPPPAGNPPRPAAPPDLRGPWGQRLLLAETAIEAEHAKDAMKQSWPEHLARLRPIAEQREEPQVARLAEAWIAQIERRMEELVAVREAEEVLRRSARESARRDRELDRIQQSREPAASGPSFAARGQLLTSVVIEREGGARLFRLQDPLTRRLEAYVEIPPDSGIDADKWLGCYVGVGGQRRASTLLGADIVRAVAIVSLEPPATAPAPARQ